MGDCFDQLSVRCISIASLDGIDRHNAGLRVHFAVEYDLILCIRQQIRGKLSTIVINEVISIIITADDQVGLSILKPMDPIKLVLSRQEVFVFRQVVFLINPKGIE